MLLALGSQVGYVPVLCRNVLLGSVLGGCDDTISSGNLSDHTQSTLTARLVVEGTSARSIVVSKGLAGIHNVRQHAIGQKAQSLSSSALHNDG